MPRRMLATAAVSLALAVPAAGVAAASTTPDQVSTSAYTQVVPATYQVTGVRADDVLNVRSGPGVRNRVIARLAPNAKDIDSTGRTAKVGQRVWREIKVSGGTTGWASGRYLTEQRPPAATPVIRSETPSTYRVTGVQSRLNVRTGPGTTHAVTGTFPRNARDIMSTGRVATVGSTTWREVKVPGATTGWVAARYLAVQGR